MTFRKWIIMALTLMLAFGAQAEGVLPQIDNSTARIPITDAIYQYFTERGYDGPEPMCSKTHGAWLNLASGDADIIFLIAPTADELQAFADAGVDIEMKVYGYDGLVFLGNASNPVESLTEAEIRNIYRGNYTNWWAMKSGTDADIEVYIRNPESGSQRLFENLVWSGYEMPDFAALGFAANEVSAAKPYKLEVSSDMGDIAYNIMQARYSIGFNIMSYVDNVFLSSKGLEQTVVTTGSVNLRDDSSLQGEKLAAVPLGTVLKYMGETVFDNRGVAWYRVEYEGNEWAWVSSRYSRLDVDNTSLKLFAVNGYEPTTENFANGNYPYVTTSYVAIRADEAEDSPARMLFDWIGSEDSREIIAENSTLSVDFTDSVVVRTGESDLSRLTVAGELASRDLERDELKPYTQSELEALWQAVYAHSGLHFIQEAYREYFEGLDWYADGGLNYAEARAAFNAHQRANLDLISEYLGMLRRARANVQPRVLGYDRDEDDMTGEDVANVQRALTDLGMLDLNNVSSYYSDAPGVFGEATRNALEWYQSANGVASTGRLDATTQMMLADPEL